MLHALLPSDLPHRRRQQAERRDEEAQGGEGGGGGWGGKAGVTNGTDDGCIPFSCVSLGVLVLRGLYNTTAPLLVLLGTPVLLLLLLLLLLKRLLGKTKQPFIFIINTQCDGPNVIQRKVCSTVFLILINIQKQTHFSNIHMSLTHLHTGDIWTCHNRKTRGVTTFNNGSFRCVSDYTLMASRHD